MKSLLVFALFASSISLADKFNLPEPARAAACSQQASNLMQEWHVASEWQQRPTTQDGTQIFHSPTDTVGSWVEISVAKDSALVARKLTAKAHLNVTWIANQNCNAKLETIYADKNSKKNSKNLFTDEDLQNEIANKTGVIYAWSPQMPYSVDGVTYMQNLQKKYGWSLVLVQDPRGKEVKNPKAPVSKKIDSLELMMRGISIHYPSVLLFKNGKILSQILPGLESQEQYEKYIKRRLE